EGKTLSIDPAATSISWRGYKPGGEHFGKIPATKGEITVTGDQVTAGTFTFDVTGLKIEDIPAEDENYGKLYGHLQSADFFDAANHPTATLEITAVEPSNAGDQIADKEERASQHAPKQDTELPPTNPPLRISGHLTMRGTTTNTKF